MSESYAGGPVVSGPASPESSGTVETAKNEAADVASTAAHETGHVVETAKTEAGAVATEAKTQAKDLYAQTRTELEEQAATQQQRVAGGLRSVGDELSSMAETSENPGIAADLARQLSTRVNGVAGWIGDRDPGSLLSDVKSYARRKPGTFIAVAALAGLAVGRLTRALAENAADDNQASASPPSGSAGTDVPAVPELPADLYASTTETATPLYDQSRASWDDVVTGEGSSDDRRDTV